MISSGRGLKFAVLFTSLSFSTHSNAVRDSAWTDDLTEFCECNASVEEAFPAVFANRLGQRNESRFLDIQQDLIERFTADPSVENDRKVILWSVYQLGAYDLAHALIRAHKAGVDVRVLTDGKSVLEERNDPSRPDDRLLRDVYELLKDAGIKVSYSHPDFEPSGNLYPRIMHEKIRIFAIRQGGNRHIKPVFAYVSTHNDTYSELVGDPLPGLGRDRLREGDLGSGELNPLSKGNVQMSFVVKNADILKMLYKNYRDQERLYGQGVGRIQDLEPQEPQDFWLRDGTRVKLSFTYGSRRRYNPNDAQAAFFEELAAPESALSVKNIHLQQFVFSYGKVQKALKKLSENRSVSIVTAVDARSAYESYTQARSMAGLYSVQYFRPTSPIIYPWKKSTRQSVVVQSYEAKADRLHTKNSVVEYEDAQGRDRYRIYTGSLNMSGNGAANKEVSFEIDSPSTWFHDVAKEQRKTLAREGYLRPLDEAALFSRLRGTSKSFGYEFADSPEAQSAFERFLSALVPEASPLSAFADSITGPEGLFRDSWLNSLVSFYRDVGASDAVAESIAHDVEENVNETDRFYLSVPSVEVMMLLSEDRDTMEAPIRNAVLGLFESRDAPAVETEVPPRFEENSESPNEPVNQSDHWSGPSGLSI